jgi:hypothetical protein
MCLFITAVDWIHSSVCLCHLLACRSATLVGSGHCHWIQQCFASARITWWLVSTEAVFQVQTALCSCQPGVAGLLDLAGWVCLGLTVSSLGTWILVVTALGRDLEHCVTTGSGLVIGLHSLCAALAP